MSSRTRSRRRAREGPYDAVCINTDVNRIASSDETGLGFVQLCSILTTFMPPQTHRKVPLLRSFGPQVRDNTGENKDRKRKQKIKRNHFSQPAESSLVFISPRVHRARQPFRSTPYDLDKSALP